MWEEARTQEKDVEIRNKVRKMAPKEQKEGKEHRARKLPSQKGGGNISSS